MTKCETGMHWWQVEARWEVQTDQNIFKFKKDRWLKYKQLLKWKKTRSEISMKAFLFWSLFKGQIELANQQEEDCLSSSPLQTNPCWLLIASGYYQAIITVTTIHKSKHYLPIYLNSRSCTLFKHKLNLEFMKITQIKYIHAKQTIDTWTAERT